MTLIHKQMDLFDAPKRSYIAHACNCVGVWGKGIAKSFKEKFPKSFQSYHDYVIGNHCLGTAFVCEMENNFYVVCLMSSVGYDSKVGDPKSIVSATTLALNDLLQQIPPNSIVYSNKFNSGLFNVPWEDTEKILLETLEKFPEITWIVCSNEVNKEGRKNDT